MDLLSFLMLFKCISQFKPHSHQQNPCSGDRGKSKRPARVLLAASHADTVPSGPSTTSSSMTNGSGTVVKNAVGELQSSDGDHVLRAALAEFGHILDVHPRLI